MVLCILQAVCKVLFDLLANPKGMYKAYVIKVNPETGEVQNVVASPTTGISEFLVLL